ncbi:unnamed protein product [Calypogeia fissa]
MLSPVRNSWKSTVSWNAVGWQCVFSNFQTLSSLCSMWEQGKTVPSFPRLCVDIMRQANNRATRYAKIVNGKRLEIQDVNCIEF